jgi:hypothetical protein
MKLEAGMKLDRFYFINSASLTSIEKHLTPTGLPRLWTCHVLLNSLEDARNRLDAAMLRMRSVVGTRRPEELRAALLESQSLRMECRALRGEVEHHKAQHGSSLNHD